jgi:hypothetical protein
VLLLNQKRRGEGACTGSCYDGEVADGQAAGRRGTCAREPGRGARAVGMPQGDAWMTPEQEVARASC